ncbi:DNA-binding transcriptional regulator, LysR family [Atopostipes suicloacalis DSM 15692]|uniref:DNA-binding transcriptional regulator, LysR family n=1 Tax=Atopostipes suicloacalis DSM 15692 TaxID=1121025 RepID=A0A1M4ZFL1_9LACT|nr:LysR family transcriptional regulator [Atopostipes suicloacalis]SHF16834.1 DNA-binding transcriptional regulator, LysR family [Atopostipes suicloacalis DSM 15692]
MNLQDLIYFHYLAESLSFTDTAAHFFVSQPSISTAIKRLETAFNASLIDRRKTLKKMELTPAGKILYKNTDEILEKLDKTRQQIEDIELGSVYFGFLPTIGGYFLPEILPKMTQFSKALKLVEEESSDIMLNLILTEEVPIAILGHEESYIRQNKIKQILLMEEEMALWVSKNHPLAKKNAVSPSEVQNEVFISLSEEYTHHRIFDKWATAHGIVEPNIVYAKEIKTVKSIAASTQMVGFMSNILMSEDTDLVKVRLEGAPKFYISLVLNTEADNSYIQQQFNEAFIEIVKGLK